MKETEAKYHHLIPQTYMSAWANEVGTLNVEFLKNPGVYEPRNKENIAGITDYHSIKAGMPFCTKDDVDKLFSPLADYIVEIDGKTIVDTLEMNSKFFDFENWIIKRIDGTLVGKKAIKREIEKIKIKDIESNWSTKYENNWNAVVSELESLVLNTRAESIPAIHKEYMMKFFVALDWRSFQSNDQFQYALRPFSVDLLDQIEIPLKERELPCLATAADEIRHELLLKFFRLYLNDDGVIYKCAESNLQHTCFHFLISDEPTYFDTSDNPSFVFIREDGLKEGIMPITPHILLAQGRCTGDGNVYYVSHITDKAVKKYNNIIKENAGEFVIHPEAISPARDK